MYGGCASEERRQTTDYLEVSSMDVFFVYATKEATYHFVVSREVGLARVTKLVRKGQKGYDCSTSMSVDRARKFVRQLQVA